MKTGYEDRVRRHGRLVFAIFLPPEEENVGFGAVNGVVDPTTGLLHTYGAPLGFGEETTLGKMFRDVLGKNDMSG